MKLQIIELEAQDDRASIRDRLASSQAPRVVLVFPNRGRTRLSQLDLVLLHREAARRGRELGLATRHPIVQAAAEAAGIANFPTLDDIPEGPWVRPRAVATRMARPQRGDGAVGIPPRPSVTSLRPTRGLHRWVWIGVAGISLLALAAAIVPSAVVGLVPVQEARQQTLSLEISSPIPGGQPGSGLASRQIEVSLEGSLRLPTTGTALAPESPAKGEALFTNLGGESVTIPEGTSVRSSGQEFTRFITTVVAELPGGQGSTVSVPIEAAATGSGGNLPANSLDSIDGPLGLQASVSNLQDLSGGSDRVRPAVAPADLQALRRALEDKLLDDARARLEEELLAGEILLPGSPRVVAVVQEAYDLSPGELAHSVGIDLELRIGALAAQEQDLATAAWTAIERSSDPEWLPVRPSLSLTNFAPGTDRTGQSVEAEAHWTEYRPIDLVSLARAITGMPVEEAGQLIQHQVDLPQSPQIEVHPAWLGRLPWIESRIQFSFPWDAP